MKIRQNPVNKAEGDILLPGTQEMRKEEPLLREGCVQ